MVITRKFLILLAASSFILCTSVAEIYADTHTAASCSYSDVSNAISAASSGDTVLIPSGSCTWSSSLSITKGVYLIGAGAGSTNITGGFAGWLIQYSPSDYSANHPFRVSGFTFDGNGLGSGIRLNYHATNLTIQTKVRIDNNLFNDFGTQAIVNNGMRGVIDNNTFTNTDYPIRNVSGPSELWWNNWEGIDMALLTIICILKITSSMPKT